MVSSIYLTVIRISNLVILNIFGMKSLKKVMDNLTICIQGQFCKCGLISSNHGRCPASIK